MTKAVRLVANTVVEIFSSNKAGLVGKFPGAFISTLLDAPDDTHLHYVYDGANFNAPVEVVPDLSATQASKVAAAFDYMSNLIETIAAANVAVSNTYHNFGCDKTSRENIMGINTAINSGVSVPSPRTWMPKGEFVPINVTHLDLATIGGATLSKVDEYFQVYYTHKYLLNTANNVDTVLAYDFTTGYDSL